MADKKFCGNGKPVGQYGGFKIGLEASKLPAPNEKGYINLFMAPTKADPNKYYIAVDDWKPDGEKQEAKRQGWKPTDPLPKDDLPF